MTAWFSWSWVISGILVGVIASAFGYRIVDWQWWAIIIPGNILATLLIDYLKEVK